ncbi:protein kinase [Nocardia salmonicida]|uniref:Protein kinase n=1 Tax=Nocardia salmonicida TaxID=53431 RepID=A0ABZ1N315_9NOCA
MREGRSLIADQDPFDTQRDAASGIGAELRAAGFDHAHQIGHGGFGVVYQCTQTALDRTVAVKVLSGDLDEASRSRFLREQQAMGRLTGHPNIVCALEVGSTESGLPFIVMQYYEQGTLANWLQRHGPLSLEATLRLGVKLAGALETAHRLGILHRDVKPANILFTDFGEPALTDFGIAHIPGGFETTPGTITASPAFTAPEVLEGEPASPASDIYSLAATLFCAVSGHAAFERRSGEQLVAQFIRITTQPVPNLRDHGIPDGLCAVIEHAMSTHPQDRQPTAAAFGAELRDLQTRHGFSADDMVLHAAAATSPIPPSGPLEIAHTNRRRSLPLELTSFVGRRNELAQLQRALGSSRLVTLVGIGGVGKTRLALRAAVNADSRNDNVWLVELGELSDESLLVDVIVSTIGLRDQSATPPEEILVDFLGAREALLVLDNCEQVVDAAAALAAKLLQSCPKLRILATSRESLGIRGESVMRVPPLAIPDPTDEPTLQALSEYEAVALFTERAASALPTFELTDDNLSVVARICHRLDGLPLPIELAAARLRAMSLEQIWQRLDDRYALLSYGNRATPSRQQTLRLCIDWSHDLCTRQEQLVWARLTVFAGSVELDAAEEVCRAGMTADDLLDTMTSLVDKSILVREESNGVVRFRMLETLRDYGRERLQELDEVQQLRRKHRDWYQQLALDAESEWISARQLEWIARLEREQPNFREALEFCMSDSPDAGLRISIALLPFWSSRGPFSEARRWLDRLLALQPGTVTAERAKALYADGIMAEVQGDMDAGAALVEEGRALAARITDPRTHAYVAHADGILAVFSGDMARACARLERALELFGPGDDAPQIAVLNMLGIAYEQRGDIDRAIACYERVLHVTESRGESVYRSYVLWAMAIAMWRHGDRSRAVQLLERALRLCRQVKDRLMAPTCFETLAWIAASENDPRRAVVLMAAGEQLVQEVGHPTILFPSLFVHHEESDRSSRQALGEREFEAARRQGRSLGFDDAIAYALREDVAALSSDVPAPATRREREVADLIATGSTSKEIAARLRISPRTVDGHIRHLLTKLGFTSRAQIAAWVAEQTRTGTS